MEYNKATQMIGPFENMLEFINYNARQYTCEGENYVITSQARYRLYEQLSKMKEENMNKVEQCEKKKSIKNDSSGRQINQKTLESVGKKIEKLPKNQNFNKAFPNLLRHKHGNKKKVKNQDYLVDNFHAILKSQEFLFKNIIKLVNFLEKDAVFNVNDKKLEQIKYKLVACTDVLSNAVSSHNFSNIINNIIEDEITRCRFRHGECKTSAEINLKTPKPKGIEAALDNSQIVHDIRKLKIILRFKLRKKDCCLRKSSKN
ncbi:interaptin-like, partial [Asbolus verrucosus]